MHDRFVAACQAYIEDGTAAERELAEIILDLYLLVPEHPLIVDYVNRRSLQALEESDGR